MADATQLPLFTKGKEQEVDSPVHLELKSYLQPFEQVLARAELDGLLPDVDFESPLSELAESSAKVSTGVPQEVLRDRLAYWQRVGTGDLKPTRQVLMEATASSEVDQPVEEVSAGDLHGRRLLRYGPHDLHQYKGKFFPQLVRSLINYAGLSEGSIVVDPFCGSGTSLAEARVLGMKGVGMDLNPLSVLIARAKSSVIEAPVDDLKRGADRVLSEVKNEQEMDYEGLWDQETLEYLNSWFDQRALEDVARIRSSIESIEQGVVNQFLKVSFSNIIRSVSWQKESDLRVRKEKNEYSEGKAIDEFASELERQIGRLESYLRLLEDRELGKLDIREGDAREADSALESYKGKCDVLITSPPYATALPYIDTDRLSLMVLGMVTRGEQRSKEREMIGNREINKTIRSRLWNTYQERKSELPASISKFIDELAEDYHTDEVGFRRRNKPSLLSKYYLDMLDSMIRARRLLKPGKLGFFVVGNNSTRVNGSKRIIPTDEFIWELGEKAGWHQVSQVDMEMLHSREIFKKNTGSSEKILAFRSTVERKAIYSNVQTSRFQPEKSDWDFKDANTQEHLHVLHPYPARFIPQIPRKAIKLFTDPGDVTLDPFAGCGTTALESILMGRPSIAVDNNAVASLITEAKVADYSRENSQLLRDFSVNLEEYLPSERSQEWTPSYRNFDYWFDETAIDDLSRLRAAISVLSGPPEKMALAVFSSIIVSSSKQDSDTRYTKVDKKYEPGSAIRKFRDKLGECVGRIEKIIDKPKSKCDTNLGDSRELSFIEDNSVNLVVTSPPYLNAYDYHKYHRHRLQWIGGDVSLARDKELGKHDKYTRKGASPDPYFENMGECFREWKRVLKPKSKALVVVGDAIVDGEAVPVADRFINLAEEIGLTAERHWTRSLPGSQKSFNKKSRIDEEHMLLFEKG